MQNYATEQLDSVHRSWSRRKWERLTTFLEENRQNIFYLFLFFSANVWLFIERFIRESTISVASKRRIRNVIFSDYSYMSEHSDLRHIMGVGIAITRGCAAALSLDYCLLLLSMSRNLLTKLKETSLNQYIPTDAHLQFHKVRILESITQLVI